jgi:menaquinone-dependent protoporphyrinogen IX oxidase
MAVHVWFHRLIRIKEGVMKRLSCIIPLVFLLCLAFGCRQDEEIAEGHQNAVIVYGSRYGSTAQTARWIAEGMGGKADVFAAKDTENLDAYRYVILGSGIYFNDLHEDMLAFLNANKEAIKDRVIAVFIVSGTPPPEAQAYLDKFVNKCEAQDPLTRAFLGWLKKELLTPEDLKGVEDFYETVNQPFEDFDRTDKSICLQFGKDILQAISALDGGK